MGLWLSPHQVNLHGVRAMDWHDGSVCMYVCRAMDVCMYVEPWMSPNYIYGIANTSRTSRKPCDTIECVHHVVSMYLGGRNRIPSNGTALRTRWGHPSGEPSSTNLQRTASAGCPNEIKTSATRPIAVARSQMLMSFSNAAAKVSAADATAAAVAAADAAAAASAAAFSA